MRPFGFTAGTRRAGTLASCTLLIGSLLGCSGSPQTVATQPPTAPANTGAPTPPPQAADPTVLAGNLQVPWGLTFLPDRTALITERDTRKVLRVQADGSAPTEVATITEADAGGEGGLLGIVASPQYAQDQTLFLYYTTSDDNRVSRWKIGSRPEPIVTGIPVSGVHNGGRLAFGPDGYLYVATGDASSTGRSQDLDSLGGKILRITADGKPAPGNPFNTQIWSYGHRNVQGIAWDSGGHLWATEFGQNDWDEINRVEPGKNYGWPEVEGAAGDPRYVDPVVAWGTEEASCSGATIVKDVLVAACLRGERLWMMRVNGAEGTLAGQPIAQLQNEYGRLRAAESAPDGSLWLLTSNISRGTPEPTDDRLLRVTVH
jgi:glucose/arabinose dehydrogenase